MRHLSPLNQWAEKNVTNRQSGDCGTEMRSNSKGLGIILNVGSLFNIKPLLVPYQTLKWSKNGRFFSRKIQKSIIYHIIYQIYILKYMDKTSWVFCHWICSRGAGETPLSNIMLLFFLKLQLFHFYLNSGKAPETFFTTKVHRNS